MPHTDLAASEPPRRRPAGRRLTRSQGLGLLSSIVIATAAGCDDNVEMAAVPAITTDTLAGGGIHVRSRAAGVWAATGTSPWRLEEVARIGRAGGEGPDVFGRIGDVVEDRAGRSWVVDPMAAEVRVFDRSGEHVRTIGRKGQGPGEFESPRAIINGPDGNIWVDDARLFRWEVFDTSGRRVAGHRGNSNLGGGIRFWTADGQLLEANYQPPAESSTGRRVLYRARTLTPSGELEPADSVFSPAIPDYESVTFTSTGLSMREPLPMAHLPAAYPGPDGDFWVTEGDGRYILRRQRVNGDTVLIIERDFKPVAVSAEARREAEEMLVPDEGMTGEDNAASRLPSVHPPFEDFFPATDSTLWVRRVVGDQQAFDVFDGAGRYLGEAESPFDPADLQVRHVTVEYMYGVIEDDLGVQSLVVLRIIRP